MPGLNPLPFRLGVPGEETIKFSGIKSTGYNIEGLLHLSDLILTLEWTGTQTTEQVGFTGVGTETVELPGDWKEIPAAEIADASVRGFWWSPRLELRSRRLDTFEDIPTGRAATLRLKIKRQDRHNAREIAEAINEACEEARLLAERGPRLLDQAEE